MRFTIAHSLWVLSQITVTLASLDANLNFDSPSFSHPHLGFSRRSILRKRNIFPRNKDYGNVKFTHGVASGDPQADAIVLWSRLAPDTPSNDVVCAEYVISKNEDLSDSVQKGEVSTSSDIDYTIKVDIKKLEPWTTYYYQFNACGSKDVKSVVGRTKTLPAEDKYENVRLGVFSCSNFRMYPS